MGGAETTEVRCLVQRSWAISPRLDTTPGALETIVTRPTVDGGRDVVSDDYVAQVNYDGSVGVEAIRELFGVATSMTT